MIAVLSIQLPQFFFEILMILTKRRVFREPFDQPNVKHELFSLKIKMSVPQKSYLSLICSIVHKGEKEREINQKMDN